MSYTLFSYRFLSFVISYYLTSSKVKVRSSKADKEAEEGEPDGGV